MIVANIVIITLCAQTTSIQEMAAASQSLAQLAATLSESAGRFYEITD